VGHWLERPKCFCAHGMPKNRFFLAFFSFFSFFWELTEDVAAGAHCGYFLQQSEANVALHFHRRHLFFSFSFFTNPSNRD
jgi:hypothetical protein